MLSTEKSCTFLPRAISCRYVHVHMYIYTYISVYIHAYVCMFTYITPTEVLKFRVCVCVCERERESVCVCVHIEDKPSKRIKSTNLKPASSRAQAKTGALTRRPAAVSGWCAREYSPGERRRQSVDVAVQSIARAVDVCGCVYRGAHRGWAYASHS